MSSNEPSKTKRRILIAEDDPDIASLLERVLQTKYQVTLAEDGLSALAQLGHPPPPDLILLDVMMPGLDGFALARRIKLLPEVAKVPIIFITARDGPEDMIKGIQVGARAYITKPFKLDAVLAKVQKALGE
jgi:putative two-component system response regulator